MSDFETLPIHHGQRTFERPGSDIKKKGNLRKLKTMKKKFFVLRGTSSSGPARLEYYDSEKKFNLNQSPKRSIDLHTCFNINKRVDRKHSYAIALYTKDDCFTVLAENKSEQDDWLSVLLEYQLQYVYHDENREHFEHVWQVNIKPKGLAVNPDHKHLRGCHRLCLSSQNICIVKLNTDRPIYVFQLATVRSLGISDCLFRMEVGSMASTGPGELWMQVEDSSTAHTMHDCIFQCMKAASSVVEVDLKIKDRTRSGTINSTIAPRSNDPSRARTNTFGACDSPSRIRSKPSDKRPVSCSPNVSISVPGQFNTLPSTSPLFNLDYPGHRLRSDSSESRASRRSKLDEDFDYFSGLNDSVDVISEEGSGQASLDFTSLPSSPSQLQEHLKMTPEDEVMSPEALSTYMVMNPGLATPPAVNHNTNAASSYMDMTARPQRTSSESSPSGVAEGYLNMSVGRPPASSPIPIRGPPEVLYKDMTCHTSHLPTVTEGGSNEGYLPMSPTSAGHSSFSSDHLKPEPAICMLAEDTTDFPKRTYSLGSKPPVSTANKNSGYLDMTINKGVADKGRSCSAPHLIPNRKIYMDSPTPSASSLSTSMRSDDSESFMEIDFYRPRTASDSFSYRPRASSFGNKTLQQAHGHRPRSSSHGQQARVFRTKAFESARTTSEELRQSMNSCRGSADSLKMSSSESLRKLSREVRAKTSSLLSTDYLDMSIDKRKTPSPQPSYITGQKPNGYVDMTLGNRSSSPSHCRLPQERSGSFSGNFNKTREKVMQERSGSFSSGTSHRIMPVSEISSKKSHSADVMHKTSSSSINELKADKNDLYMNMDMSLSQTSNESRKSDKDSRSSSSENLESYVMYEPKVTTNTSNTSSSIGSKKSSSSQRPMSESFRHVSERPIRKDPRRKSSHLSKTNQWFSSHPEQSQIDKNDEYIEFSPMATKSMDPNSNMVSHQRQHSNPKRESIISHGDQTPSRRESKSTNKSVECSDYIGFAPGQIGVIASENSGHKTPENGDSSEYMGFAPGHIGIKKEEKGDSSEYMGFEPGNIGVKPDDKGNNSEYMGFEPGNIGVKPDNKGNNSEYMGYEPGKNIENGKSSPVASQMVVQKSYFGNTSSVPKTSKKSGQVKSKSVPVTGKDENEYLNFEPAASVNRKNKQNNSKTQKVIQKSINVPMKSMSKDIPKTVEETKPNLVTDDYLLTEKLETCVATTTPIPVPINPPCIISVEDGNSKKVVKSPVQKKGSSNSLTSGQDGSVVKDTKIPARRSLSDLSGYEQMNFQSPNIKVQMKQGSNSSVTSTGVADGKTLTSLGSPSNIVSSMCNLSVNVPIATNTSTLLPGNEECLNYAKLDLGSSETIGEDGVRSPRIKSRHASAADEKSEPLSYAEIDFEKSENMKTLATLKIDN